MKWDAIILGAGAAGLAAAKILSDAGCTVLIIEARQRIGGRILTLTDSKFNLPIELGAEFIHGHPLSTWNLVHQAGLTAFDLPFAHKQLRRGHLVDLDTEDELSGVMGGLAHLGRRDESFAEYLRRHRGGSAQAREFAASFVEGFDAADPEIISAKSIAAEQQGVGDVENETQFRLLGGYKSLVDYLHGSLDPKRVGLQLGTPITEIKWRKSRVELRSAHLQRFAAKRALITLPLSIAKNPGAVRFIPEISQWRKYASQLAFGTVVKAVLRFREPFWEDDKNLRDAVFLHDWEAKFPTWWTARPLRIPILTAWAGGPRAQALAGLSRDQTLHAAIGSLSKLVHRSPRELNALMDQFLYCDWSADPYARGAYSYVAVGGSSARSHLSRPIASTLYFAGEAVDISGQASTVAGALSSAHRAAKQILASI
jgi:monoamine oxidase